MRGAYVDVPEGWTRLGGRGLGPFVTREVFRRPDGTRVTWESRWHRKHPGMPDGSTWWAPRAIAWWIGVLFAVGSVCFALGSFPPYATGVGTNPDDLTYFIGSIFFTTASFLVYYETASTPTSLGLAQRKGLGSLFWVQHRRIDWWAAIIQFVGTLWFNRTTLERARRGARRVCGPPSRVASRCPRVGLLPGLELVVVGRGVPRAVRLAPVVHLVVDHLVEPGGLRRVRRFGHRLLRQAERRSGEPRVDESGHVRRCGLLPDRSCPPAARADPRQPVRRSAGQRPRVVTPT